LAVLRIYEFPHSVLRQKAKKVRRVDRAIQRLADDLVDTLRDAGGVGLAANQVGVLRRVIVVQLPEEEEPRVYVNPEVVHRQGEREVEEACLSVPGYRGIITRAVRVKFKGLDRSARLVRIRAEGLLAQAMEHEVDHLNGILYMDHLESHQDLIKNEPEPEHADSEVAVV
jgi:peptide deformylase